MFKSTTKINFDFNDKDDLSTLATIRVAWSKEREMYEVMLYSLPVRRIAEGYFREWSSVLGFLSVVEALPKNDKSFVALVKIELAERKLRIQGCHNE